MIILQEKFLVCIIINFMKKVELLAPAKDKKTAIAAINSGCDAIYIGASNFGARKKVPNSLEDIKEQVNHPKQLTLIAEVREEIKLNQNIKLP